MRAVLFFPVLPRHHASRKLGVRRNFTAIEVGQ